MSDSNSEDEGGPYKTLFQKATSSARSHAHGETSQPLFSSILAPNAFWTGADKELFFHGLTRYSRLRPDLIASHVGNCKTPVDVMAYIASLEEGLKSDDGDEKRHIAPGARCVSTKWIKYEEKQASLLARKEVEWEKALQVKHRASVLKDGQNKLRKPREKGFIRDLEARRLEQERRTEWELQTQVQQLAWDREDAMESLGPHELSFLDSLIRNVDGASISREPSARAETAPPDGSEPIRAESPVDTSTMTPTERRRFQKRLHMRKKRAEMTGKAASTEKGRLRPGRKVTDHQRSYRSREADSAPSTRASSRNRSPQQDLPPDDPVRDDHEESSDGEELDAKGSKARGLTVAQQVQLRFTELEVTIETLRERGLDLFNLSKFYSLSNILAEASNVPTAQLMSTDTLELLRAVLDEFLHKIMYRTIVLAEEERTMKEHTKVWRAQLNDIKPYHVTDALHLMGMQIYQSKAPFLARLNAALEGQVDPGSSSPELEAPPSTSILEALQNIGIYAPLISHPSLLDPDTVDVQDVLLPSDDEDTGNIRAREEGMAQLAREVVQEQADEKLDARHEAHLWRLMRGEHQDEKDGDESDLGDDESMEESGEGGDDETMAEDEGDDGKEDEEVRSRLMHGAPGGPNLLRLVSPGGDVKSPTFILDSDDDEKDSVTMSEGE